ncbi:MAG TPA: vitamin K epoxide reductase family protein [Chthoniobacterales bacterium]|nr:vitamin K epoxide reductase family protein [Chthoniobacterales bacterium]
MKDRKGDQKAKSARPRVEMFLYAAAALIAVTGLGEAIYLTVMFLTGELAICGGSSGCMEVLGSKFAHIRGIPIAAFGAAAYFAAFSCATFAAFGYARARRLFTIVVGGMFLFTLWLLFVQAFLLHAFCKYCLFSAAMIFLLAGIGVSRPVSD